MQLQACAHIDEEALHAVVHEINTCHQSSMQLDALAPEPELGSQSYSEPDAESKLGSEPPEPEPEPEPEHEVESTEHDAGTAATSVLRLSSRGQQAAKEGSGQDLVLELQEDYFDHEAEAVRSDAYTL